MYGEEKAGFDLGREFARLIDRRRAVLILLLMIASSLSEGAGLLLLIPIAQSAIPDSATALGGWFGEIALASALALFVGAVALRALLQYAIAMLSAGLTLGMTAQIRSRVQAALIDAEWRWLSRQQSARMANLITQQAERIAAHGETVLASTAGLVTAVVLTTTASALAPVFTAVAITAGLLVAATASAMRGRAQAEGTVYLELSERLQALVDNGVAHLRAAKIARAEDSLRRSFGDAAGQVQASETRYIAEVERARAVLHILAAVSLAALVYGAIAWELVPVAILVPLLVIFARLVPIAMRLQQARRSWQFTKPAFARMLAVIREAKAEPDAGEQAQMLSPRHGLSLSAVTMIAGGRAIVDDVSASFPVGSVTLVTGPSGSGKSTLADILCGLIEPDAGTLSIDGVALTDAARRYWRSRVAYVEQHPFFWSGSLRDNLTWGEPRWDDKALENALALAAADFTREVPGGLDYRLGDGGTPLSGGEKRRLAIARALLREPDLLILDEVFASLDPALRRRLLTHLGELGTTVVVISHDPIAGLEPDATITLKDRPSQD